MTTNPAGPMPHPVTFDAGRFCSNTGIRVRKSSLILIVLLALTLSGCGTRAPVAPAETAGASADFPTTLAPAGTITASASIVPVRTSDLAFPVSGRVKEIAVKEGQQVRAGQTLIVLDTPDLDSDLQGAQARLEAAQADEAFARAGRRQRVIINRRLVWIGTMPEVRAQFDARLLQAEADLALAQANIAQAKLVAPFDGTVVSLDVQPAEMVTANEKVATIGDLAHLQVETTDLSERDIAGVRVGQTASLTLKAFDGPLSGKVIAVAPKSNEYKDDNVFKVTIELTHPQSGLLWGMTGDIEINIGG